MSPSRSHAFASEGQPAFSWTVSRTAEEGDRAFHAQSRNHPDVEAFGSSEQRAIRAATAAMESFVDQSKAGR